jgi:hypothetical protein
METKFMSDADDKALHAYEHDAFQDLLMGRYPYYMPEAYMAPSDVPTNWSKALKGLGAIAATRPDVPARLESALTGMVSSPEALYCALATVLDYLDIRKFLPATLQLDVPRILHALSPAIERLEPEARSLHLDWMGPSAEVLWERIERTKKLLIHDHGLGDCFAPPR